MLTVLKHKALTPLADGEVHLWYADPGKINDLALLRRYESLLSAQELASYRELKMPSHSQEYLVSQAFLRDVLSHYCACEPATLEFQRNASGKPTLKTLAGQGPELHFNLSHTAGFAVCGVSLAGTIGVDVEVHENGDRGMLDVADHYFSAREMESLNACSEEEQEEFFFQIWTLKEAYIKARGMGLALALDSFSFELGNDGQIELFENERRNAGDNWQFWSLRPRPGVTAAIAVEASSCQLRAFESVPLRHEREVMLTQLGLVA